MAITPYVSAAAFRAHPTAVDTEGINTAVDAIGDPDAQTAELTNLLLAASEWADNEVDQPLSAHLYTQRERVFAGRDGRLSLHADHGPVVEVTEVGYGYGPGALTTLTSPEVWVEQDTNLIISMGSSGTVGWSGSLQFGSPAAGCDVFVQTTYVAGHVATVLTEPADEDDVSITVLDPTGIVPGGILRIWEPGVEESVAVARDWVPPTPSSTPEPASVSLVRPLRNAHTEGHDLSGLSADLRKAIILHTISQLLRPDSAAEAEYPDNASSSTRKDDSRPTGMGLLKEARRILAGYGRVR
ncbi:hypothetical protein ABTZ78_17470 [Streptomyces bauhiniae]|uniref:hypothetical protein n=1 Tax=Streptomyces bauhiniae TaxID=2340725 RepID=UPI00332F737D